MIKFSGEKLQINSNPSVTFKYEISDAIEFEKMIIVLLKVPVGIIHNENIFGIDYLGNTVWQIKKMIPDSQDSPFLEIKKEGDSLYAHNWSGIRAKVKVDTGEIVHKKITK